MRINKAYIASKQFAFGIGCNFEDQVFVILLFKWTINIFWSTTKDEA